MDEGGFLYNLKESAALLHLPVEKVEELIAEGALSSVTYRGTTMIRQTVIDTYIRDHAQDARGRVNIREA